MSIFSMARTSYISMRCWWQQSESRHVGCFGFQANLLLHLLHNYVCLAEKQQIPVLKSLVCVLEEHWYVLVWFMVFNATLNNISVILWSVLLVEETGVTRENHWPVASNFITWTGFEFTALVVIKQIAQIVVNPTTIW